MSITIGVIQMKKFIIGVIASFLIMGLYVTSVFLFNHLLSASSPNDIAGYGISFIVMMIQLYHVIRYIPKIKEVNL